MHNITDQVATSLSYLIKDCKKLQNIEANKLEAKRLIRCANRVPIETMNQSRFERKPTSLLEVTIGSQHPPQSQERVSKFSYYFFFFFVFIPFVA